MRLLDSRGGIDAVGVERYQVPDEYVGFSSVAYNSDGPMSLYETGANYEKITFATNFGWHSKMNMVV